jgi:spore coat protein U-like protein
MAIHPYNPGGDLTTQVTSTAIAAGNVVLRGAGSSRLVSVLVQTATAVAAVSIFDNATTNSGTVIGVIPIGAVGMLTFNMPAANGITIGVSAGLTGGPFTFSLY